MPLGAAADCGGNATRGLCLCRSYCGGVLNLDIDNVKYGRTDVKLCVGLDTSYRRIVISVNPHPHPHPHPHPLESPELEEITRGTASLEEIIQIDRSNAAT